MAAWLRCADSRHVLPSPVRFGISIFAHLIFASPAVPSERSRRQPVSQSPWRVRYSKHCLSLEMEGPKNSKQLVPIQRRGDKRYAIVSSQTRADLKGHRAFSFWCVHLVRNTSFVDALCCQAARTALPPPLIFHSTGFQKIHISMIFFQSPPHRV
ncbi:hypothetical protein C8R43DRAFT_638796 [Mycena crocata]|nr:hypothetical protein C8R43DRAFT_638796 [Mycena crocata]